MNPSHSLWSFWTLAISYLHAEVRIRTLRLLKESDATGDAIGDLQAGETKDAVVKAHKSIESVMKTALGTSEHLTYGKLLERLIKCGLIPTYYEEFIVHFEKLALGAVKERNRPGTGHGQGNVTVDVPRSLAEFVVNLAGSINLFIIEEGQKACNRSIKCKVLSFIPSSPYRESAENSDNRCTQGLGETDGERFLPKRIRMSFAEVRFHSSHQQRNFKLSRLASPHRVGLRA